MSDEWAGGESGELVYGEINDGLVFMGEQKAHEHVAIHGALESASTWGELRDKLPGDAHPQMLALLDGGDDELPDDADVFDAGEFGPYADGDWPPWPAQRMLDWVPDRVRALGSSEPSVINGDFLELDPALEHKLVEVFADEGFTCRRDDALVRRASGYDA